MPQCLLFPSLRPLWKIILFESRGSASAGQRGAGGRSGRTNHTLAAALAAASLHVVVYLTLASAR